MSEEAGTIIVITIVADVKKLQDYRDLEHLANELDSMGLKYKWIEKGIKSKSEFRRLSYQIREE